jgi:hypothetical protein
MLAVGNLHNLTAMLKSFSANQHGRLKVRRDTTSTKTNVKTIHEQSKI